MTTTSLIKHLAWHDLKQILRDQTLAPMMALGVVIAVVIRHLLPMIDQQLALRGVLPNPSLDTRLSDVFPMLVTYFGFFNGAQLVGVIFGFLLVEEKDQRTLIAIEVTPTSMKRYALCRLLLPTALGFVTCTMMVLIINQAVLPLGKLVLLALCASPTSPIIALFLATYSDNKIEAFAVAKFAGIGGLTILFGWFVPGPAQWLFGLFPPFLASKAYWMALEGEPLWWLAGLAGFALQIGLVVLLAHQFQRG